MPEQRSSGEGNGIIRRILLKLGMAGADDQPRAQHDSELTEIVADQGSTQATTILRRSSSSPNFGSTDQAPSLIARDSVPIEAALLLVHLQKSSVQVKSQDGLTILSFLIDTLTSSSVELFRIDNDQRILLESKTISFPEISIPIDLKIDEIDPFSQTFEIHLNASVHPSKLIKGGRFTASQEITTLQITPEDAEAVRVTGQTIRVRLKIILLYNCKGWCEYDAAGLAGNLRPTNIQILSDQARRGIFLESNHYNSIRIRRGLGHAWVWGGQHYMGQP